MLNILQVTELDRLLPTFDDEDAAVAHLSGDAKENVSRHTWR